MNTDINKEIDKLKGLTNVKIKKKKTENNKLVLTQPTAVTFWRFRVQREFPKAKRGKTGVRGFRNQEVV